MYLRRYIFMNDLFGLRHFFVKLSKPVIVEECHPTITLEDFSNVTVIPALLIVLVASLLQRRKNRTWGQTCSSRPGIPVPVNLLDGYEDRFVYAAAFGSTATNCLTLLSYHFYLPEAVESTRILYAMWSVTIMCIDYYPFFACISHRRSVIWSLVGAVYSSLWFAVNLLSAIECSDPSDWLIPGQPVIIQLPVLVCLASLVFVFLFRVIEVTKRLITREDREPCCRFSSVRTDQTQAHLTLHVKRLFKKYKHDRVSASPAIFGLRSLHRYKRDQTFRYSPRIVSTIFVTLLCLYEFSLLAFIYVEKGMKLLRGFLTTDSSDQVHFVYSDSIRGQVTLFLDVLHISWYISFSVSVVALVTYLFAICISYRGHYRSLLKGDNSFIPPSLRTMSNTNIMSYSLMYSGLQIAFMFWAFSLMTLTLMLCDVIVAYFLILPSMGLVSMRFLDPLWNLLPTIAVSCTVYILQILTSKTILLQEGSPDKSMTERLGGYLALNNRRIFHNVSYFLFFYYIILGLFRSFLRVLLGIAHGVVYLARLDCSGLQRGFEHWDKGYSAYISLLRLEVAHCHPVLVTFCHVLLEKIRSQRSLPECEKCHRRNQSSVTSRARRKWFLVYTLIKNRNLIKYRKDISCWRKDPVIIISDD